MSFPLTIMAHEVRFSTPFFSSMVIKLTFERYHRSALSSCMLNISAILIRLMFSTESSPTATDAKAFVSKTIRASASVNVCASTRYVSDVLLMAPSSACFSYLTLHSNQLNIFFSLKQFELNHQFPQKSSYQ